MNTPAKRKYHAVAELFPLLDGAEFDVLVKDIEVNGLRDLAGRW